MVVQDELAFNVQLVVRLGWAHGHTALWLDRNILVTGPPAYMV
ncbi:MAG: hypothetical protein N2595_08545 [bacterium]|nr:hypothetical protein [bacterium]